MPEGHPLQPRSFSEAQTCSLDMSWLKCPCIKYGHNSENNSFAIATGHKIASVGSEYSGENIRVRICLRQILRSMLFVLYVVARVCKNEIDSGRIRTAPCQVFVAFLFQSWYWPSFQVLIPFVKKPLPKIAQIVWALERGLKWMATPCGWHSVW